jgi:hypothetical protein
VAASIIAVVQAAGATGSIIQKFIELKRADEEFLIFSNEVKYSFNSLSQDSSDFHRCQIFKRHYLQ